MIGRGTILRGIVQVVDTVTIPEFEPEVADALRDATKRIDDLHSELLDTLPVFQGTMAIPGILIGHGLGCLVANGMTNDQIVAHVLAIVTGIRQQLLVS